MQQVRELGQTMAHSAVKAILVKAILVKALSVKATVWEVRE